MSLEQFLKEAMTPDTTQQWHTVAKCHISLAYQGFAGADTQIFEFPYGNPQAKAKAKADCQTFLDSQHGKGNQWPRLGLSTTIHGEDVPTHPQGKFQKDWIDFVGQYYSDASLDQLSEEEKEKVTGPMPYNLVIDSIKSMSELADGKLHWCKLAQEVDQWQKAKGNKRVYTDNAGEQKETDRRIWVVKKVYTSEKEAKTDAENLKHQSSSDDTVTSTVSSLSETATANGVSLEYLQANIDEINNHIGNATQGIGTPKSKKLPLMEAKKYVCAEMYGIEVTDLALLEVEAPF